ncbi:MAG: 3-isopropylmalate/(R)-2-methylmalate dehydratase large subunit [Myxococcota bacterium]|jgi:3-isopropylmalate/(R)-2-methylmalate dehydratase large subunit
MTESWPPSSIRLSPDKRILFLTKDLELIRKQLHEGLNLRMQDLTIDDLLDDINTDVMTPAWVCFRHRPEDIATDAYAGLVDEKGKRVIGTRELMDGNFEAIVSGYRKGTGSSRETAAQCERFSGIRYVFAASFAPIHERNNINLGQLMSDHSMLSRLQDGETVELDEFTSKYDDVTKVIIECGGLFQFSNKVAADEIVLPANTTPKRGMTMAEKMIAAKMLNPGTEGAYVKPGDPVLAKVDGGYSHEFTTAQVHYFLSAEYGKDYQVQNPEKLGVFEDHLLYADSVKRFAPFVDQIQTLRDLQNEFQRHTGVRDYQAKDGVSPGICHQIAREEIIEPGDFIQATDSHTCMGGASNALTYGVGATEYAALIYSGFTFVKVPETIRFDLVGEMNDGVTAKDVMLHVLDTFAKREDTLNRSMEFGGSGMTSMPVDERATLCNMATECTARTGICEGDEKLVEWFASARPELSSESIRAKLVMPDADAEYAGGRHTIDLSTITPMVATPGDPTYGAYIAELPLTKIDIAYGGSCTAGKVDDFAYYAKVCQEAADAGLRVADGVEFYIQYGSYNVQAYAEKMGWDKLFAEVGVRLIPPGCGACIGCGDGVSENAEQVTVSAINRNFAGRSGPGQLYLASPLTVAASAFYGSIVAYKQGMFALVSK